MVEVAKGPIDRRWTESGLRGPVPSRVDVKEALLEEEAPPSSVRSEKWPAERQTGTRHRQQSIANDEVGSAAVSLASDGLRPNAPTLVASNATIAKAPIDTRAAFILSLVDGRTSAAAIVEMSGMDADEVNGILERLVRLGLITLP